MLLWAVWSTGGQRFTHCQLKASSASCTPVFLFYSYPVKWGGERRGGAEFAIRIDYIFYTTIFLSKRGFGQSSVFFSKLFLNLYTEKRHFCSPAHCLKHFQLYIHISLPCLNTAIHTYMECF